MTVNAFSSPVGGNLENIIRGNDNALRDAINGVLASYVSGPSSSTDNALVRWDGTTGRFVQDSTITVNDTGGVVIAAGANSPAVEVTSTGVYQLVLRYDSGSGNNIGFRVSSVGDTAWRPQQNVFDRTMALTYRLGLGDTSGNINVSRAVSLYLPAAETGLSPLRIPHGTAPSSPGDGDMWTTSAGLFVRISGVTVGPLS